MQLDICVHNTDLGINRILTSGQAETPFDGMETLKNMVDLALRRIMIIAVGVIPEDIREIIQQTGVDEVYSAANKWCSSHRDNFKEWAKMGHGGQFFA